MTSRLTLGAAVAVSLAGVQPARAAAGEPETGGPAKAAVVARQARRRGATLDGRVKQMSKELDLSLAQEAQLKRVLQSHREQVARIWADPSVAPAQRIHATQVVGEQTSARIRALLDDRQRQLYKPPPLAQRAAGSGPSVEEWMSKGKQ